MPGTGFDKNRSCVPKLSLFEFALMDGSMMDASTLGYTPYLQSTKADGFGTDANFQTKWLLGEKEFGSLSSAIETLKTFKLVGTTDALDVMKYVLSRIVYHESHVVALSRVCANTAAFNPSNHGSVLSELTPEQYNLIARRHADDIRLYYWATMQVNFQIRCFNITKHVCHAKQLEASTSPM